MQIETGSRVVLHYTLSLAATGKIAETTRGAPPAQLVVGRSDLLPVFENCLLGLTAGEVRRFEIASRDAYGETDEPEIEVMPRTDFPPDMALAPGLVIGFELPSGQELPGTVVEVSEHEVHVDFSHPLAGHDLVFDVEILEVGRPPG